LLWAYIGDTSNFWMVLPFSKILWLISKEKVSGRSKYRIEKMMIFLSMFKLNIANKT
jgi:hypothetical protein